MYEMELLEIFDIAMPAVAMAQGFGRIGCLLAGCCYGIELDPANPIDRVPQFRLCTK